MRLSPEERERRAKGKVVARKRARGANDVDYDYEVRLDGDGVFWSKHLDAWYSAKTMEEVCRLVEEAARVRGEISWSTYVEIEEVVYEPEGQHYVGGKRSDPQVYLYARWRVISLSDPIPRLPGMRLRRYGIEGDRYRLRREVVVEEGGELRIDRAEDAEAAGEDPSDGCTWVPWSPERWRALEEVAAAARQLGGRLAAVLRGPGAASFLDAQAGPAPMALAELPPPSGLPDAGPAKKRRR